MPHAVDAAGLLAATERFVEDALRIGEVRVRLWPHSGTPPALPLRH
jgi:hypothetical protein